MTAYIRPLQDVSGIGSDGFNPRQEIESIKKDIENNVKKSISGLVGNDEEIISNLRNLGDAVNSLEDRTNTMYVEEVLYEGSAGVIGDIITLNDDYTKFIDLKAQFNFDGFIIKPFSIPQNNLFITREFNISDNPTNTMPISMYEVQIEKVNNKKFRIRNNSKINVYPNSFSITPSNATLMKITGRRIKK